MSEADPELLETVMERRGLVADPDSPDWLDWLVYRVRTLAQFWWHTVSESEGMGTVAWAVAGLLAAVVVTLALLALLRLVNRLLRPQDSDRSDGVRVTPVLARQDPVDFQNLARDALRAGRTTEAVRATWLWVAWSMDARGTATYLPDLTNREFVARVRDQSPGWTGLGRLDSFARRVETACYGGAPVTGREAEQLFGIGASLVGAGS